MFNTDTKLMFNTDSFKSDLIKSDKKGVSLDTLAQLVTSCANDAEKDDKLKLIPCYVYFLNLCKTFVINKLQEIGAWV